MRSAIWEVFGGLVASGAIYLAMFAVVLGPLQNQIAFSQTLVLWDAITYVPYAAMGLVSFARGWKSFGLTLLVVGLVGVIALNGFLFGLSGSFV